MLENKNVMKKEDHLLRLANVLVDRISNKANDRKQRYVQCLTEDRRGVVVAITSYKESGIPGMLLSTGAVKVEISIHAIQLLLNYLENYELQR